MRTYKCLIYSAIFFIFMIMAWDTVDRLGMPIKAPPNPPSNIQWNIK